MPNTTNFNWATPADTDLVKDGAAAIRTLGNSIDTSFVDLKGGTTGQNLRKNSNTDLDFTWAGDATNTVIDAAGDLLYGTAADTLSRLPIGTANQVLTVNSGATAPEWTTISTGGLTSLATGTLSGTAVNITNIPTTYVNLYIVVRDMRSSSDGGELYMRVQNDSNTRYGNQTFFASTLTNRTFGAAQWPIYPGGDDTVSENLTIINLYDYANTSTWKMGMVNSIAVNETTNTNYNCQNRTLYYNQTGAINEINFIGLVGDTFTGGTYTIYGVK